MTHHEEEMIDRYARTSDDDADVALVNSTNKITNTSIGIAAAVFL